MEPRDVDARICEAIRASKKKPGGITSAELADRVGVSRDYLRARLRFMERTERLPADVAAKLPKHREPVSNGQIETAWRKEVSTSAVARGVGLSRAGVLQRVAKLRAAGVELQARPHGALTPTQRVAQIDQRIQGKRRRRSAPPEAPAPASASVPASSPASPPIADVSDVA